MKIFLLGLIFVTLLNYESGNIIHSPCNINKYRKLKTKVLYAFESTPEREFKGRLRIYINPARQYSRIREGKLRLILFIEKFIRFNLKRRILFTTSLHVVKSSSRGKSVIVYPKYLRNASTFVWVKISSKFSISNFVPDAQVLVARISIRNSVDHFMILELENGWFRLRVVQR